MRTFKRDREDEHDPVVVPEVKPPESRQVAPSATEGVVTEPLLTIEIRGEEFVFLVDTGAMVSLIKPNIRGATRSMPGAC
jgi:hypothetical protein